MLFRRVSKSRPTNANEKELNKYRKLNYIWRGKLGIVKQVKTHNSYQLNALSFPA